jgi:hypothetical protein
MTGHHREGQRLLELAVEYGFDRALAVAALDSLVNLYGTAAFPALSALRAPTANFLRIVLFSCNGLAIWLK